MRMQQSFCQFDQVSVLSEPIQAEAEILVNTRQNAPPLNPADHSMAASTAHLKGNVGGHLADLGEEKEQESDNQVENKSTAGVGQTSSCISNSCSVLIPSTDNMQPVIPRNGVEAELIGDQTCDILKLGNSDLNHPLHDSNGFEDELRKGSKQPGSGKPSHFHNSIPTLLQSAHDDHQVLVQRVGHVDGSNADHCHVTHRSPHCGHHSHMMSSPVSAISTDVELAGHFTGELSGDDSMASLSCENFQERSTESVMLLPDMFLKKDRPDEDQMVAGNHVESEVRKTTKRPFSGAPSLQHNSFPDSIVTTSRALNLDPPVKSGTDHNNVLHTTHSTAGGQSDQAPHKLADSSYLQSLAKVSVPPHSGSSSKNHNSISNLVASE